MNWKRSLATVGAFSFAFCLGVCLIYFDSTVHAQKQNFDSSAAAFYPAFTVPSSTKFSWVNQLSTTVSDFSNRENFSLPTNAVDPNWRLWLNSGTYASSVTAAISLNPLSGNSYFDLGVFIRESSSGKFIFWGIDSSGGNPFRLRALTFATVATAPTALSVVSVNTVPVIFLRISEAGGTRSYQFSMTGWDWDTFFSEPTGTFITANQAGIGMANFTSVTEQFSVFHYAQL